MLSEDFVSAVSGPPLAANTAISKDIGIYNQSLTPSYAVKASFKKSSCPKHGLAVNATHVFSAQDQKAHVHVYSRQRGNQEALVSFAERVRSVSLAGNVLVVGTTEGRLILWETSTGRQVATPPCHVQAVSCLAVAPNHILSGSEDSNINVWSRARLLDLDSQLELEPSLVLSNHRGAVTDLVTGPGFNRETNVCISSSRDKTCIVWNYQTGHALRTILFPTAPLCLTIDPCAHVVYAATEGRAVYLVELFGEKPLLGSQADEPSFIVVQVNEPLSVADEDVGEINCIASSYDGTTVLTGHATGRVLRWSLAPGAPPTELANLNTSVSNLIFTPLLPREPSVQPQTVVKPNQAQRQHVLTAQLKRDEPLNTRFNDLLNAQGFPKESLEQAIALFSPSGSNGNAENGGEGGMQIPNGLMESMKASTFKSYLST